MPSKKHVGLAVLLFLVLQIITPILPGVDFLPPEYTMTYEVTSERLEQELPIKGPNAHGPFVGYYVLESKEEVLEGKDVWGNVTSYYSTRIEPSIWRVYLLTEADYEDANFENVHRRSIAVLSNPTRCCMNSSEETYGYAASFRFHSNETTGYAFMYDAPFASRTVVTFFVGGLVDQWWKQYVRIIEWILGVVIAIYAVLLFFRRDGSNVE